ncbi:ribonuclease [Bacteriophage Eos]|nr:ribonuclease [Bacteriophage Eos]
MFMPAHELVSLTTQHTENAASELRKHLEEQLAAAARNYKYSYVDHNIGKYPSEVRKRIQQELEDAGYIVKFNPALSQRDSDSLSIRWGV